MCVVANLSGFKTRPDAQDSKVQLIQVVVIHLIQQNELQLQIKLIVKFVFILNIIVIIQIINLSIILLY